ncbi:MAG: ParB N-terminal domain-containing protein [Patescibacteria group bacterium]
MPNFTGQFQTNPLTPMLPSASSPTPTQTPSMLERKRMTVKLKGTDKKFSIFEDKFNPQIFEKEAPQKRGFELQDLLPIAGGIAGSFLPGLGTIAGSALGAGAGKLLERGIRTKSEEGEDVTFGGALGSAAKEGAIFGGLGLGFKALPAIGRLAGKAVRGLPTAAEVVTGASRQGIKGIVNRPATYRGFLNDPLPAKGVVDKLRVAAERANVKAGAEYRTGIEAVKKVSGNKVLDARLLQNDVARVLTERDLPGVLAKIANAKKLKTAVGEKTPFVGDLTERLTKILSRISSSAQKGTLTMKQSRILQKQLDTLGRVSRTPETQEFRGLIGQIQKVLRNKRYETYKGLEQVNKAYGARIRDVRMIQENLPNMNEIVKNPDAGEAFIKSLLRKATEITPGERAITREILQRLEKESGVPLLRDLELLKSALEQRVPFKGLAGQPFVAGQQILQRGVRRTAEGVGKASQAIQTMRGGRPGFITPGKIPGKVLTEGESGLMGVGPKGTFPRSISIKDLSPQSSKIPIERVGRGLPPPVEPMPRTKLRGAAPPIPGKTFKSPFVGIQNKNEGISLKDISGYNVPLKKVLPKNEINEQAIKKYMKEIIAGKKIEPIVLSKSTEKGKFLIDDGSHRVEAMRRLGFKGTKKIEVKIVK